MTVVVYAVVSVVVGVTVVVSAVVGVTVAVEVGDVETLVVTEVGVVGEVVVVVVGINVVVVVVAVTGRCPSPMIETGCTFVSPVSPRDSLIASSSLSALPQSAISPQAILSKKTF